jgi:hypothetical protein
MTTILDIRPARNPKTVYQRGRMGLNAGLVAPALRQVGGSGLDLAFTHHGSDSGHRAGLRDSAVRARLEFVNSSNDKLRGLSSDSREAGASALSFGAVAAEAGGDVCSAGLDKLFALRREYRGCSSACTRNRHFLARKMDGERTHLRVAEACSDRLHDWALTSSGLEH